MKPQEKLFYIFIMFFKKTYPICNSKFTCYYVSYAIDVFEQAGYSRKQLLYYLSKWERKGFYDYGVGIEFGWFNEDKIPQVYLDLMNF